MAERLEEGRALCLWGDAGWGPVVRQAWAADAGLSDELVTAAAELVESWSPEPAPAWVTCVPSRRRPGLVKSFAERLALALRLPFDPVIATAGEARPQAEMDNSAQQVRNLHGAFALVEPPRPESVLLVDDLVDSRWTLTVVGALLGRQGVAAVHPLVLAKAGGG